MGHRQTVQNIVSVTSASRYITSEPRYQSILDVHRFQGNGRGSSDLEVHEEANIHVPSSSTFQAEWPQ